MMAAVPARESKARFAEEIAARPQALVELGGKLVSWHSMYVCGYMALWNCPVTPTQAEM